MASLGEDLRRERESRSVSLEQIAQQTKVSVRHLRALETDRLELLPGGVFNRGILRSYLQFLELDEQPWLARFAELQAAPPPSEPNEWLRYAQTVTGLKTSPPGEEDVRFRWLGVLILFLLLATAGWFTYRFAVKHWRQASAIQLEQRNALLYCGHVFDGQAAPADRC